MRIRPAAIAAAAAVAVLLGGCASNVAGTAAPAAAGVSLPGTALPSGLPTDLPTAPSGLPSDLPTVPATDDTVAPPTDEPTDEPTEPTDEPSLPTDLPTGELPTSLPTAIPGLSPECNAIYQVILLFAAPMMGNGAAITAAQVETAFGGVAGLGADLQDDLAILKTAAQAMIGKTGTEAIMVLGDPQVSPALTNLTNYMSTACGYGG